MSAFRLKADTAIGLADVRFCATRTSIRETGDQAGEVVSFYPSLLAMISFGMRRITGRIKAYTNVIAITQAAKPPLPL